MRWKYIHTSHFTAIVYEHGGIVCEWETHDPGVSIPTDEHGRLMAMAPRLKAIVKDFILSGLFPYGEAKKIIEELKE